MNKTEAMKRLKAAGSEQTRKTYIRHGAAGEIYGVKYGDLEKIRKSIGVDQKLADQLWATGNHDARTLATQIADPEQMTQSKLDAWAKTANSQFSLDAVAALAMQTKHALKCFEKWAKSKQEWTAAAGWHVLAGGCCGRPGKTPSPIEAQPDSFFAKQLDHIEKHIHTSPNRVRYSMNGALIAIGGRGGALSTKALAAAKRIGKVEVDHGDTSCKTPDAYAYIEKMNARAAAKKKTSKKKTQTKKSAKKTSAKKTTRKVAAATR